MLPYSKILLSSSDRGWKNYFTNPNFEQNFCTAFSSRISAIILKYIDVFLKKYEHKKFYEHISPPPRHKALKLQIRFFFPGGSRAFAKRNLSNILVLV